jgi:hypothetical protein
MLSNVRISSDVFSLASCGSSYCSLSSDDRRLDDSSSDDRLDDSSSDDSRFDESRLDDSRLEGFVRIFGTFLWSRGVMESNHDGRKLLRLSARDLTQGGNRCISLNVALCCLSWIQEKVQDLISWTELLRSG